MRTILLKSYEGEILSLGQLDAQQLTLVQVVLDIEQSWSTAQHIVYKCKFTASQIVNLLKKVGVI